MSEPNLFVPDDVPDYALAQKFATIADAKRWRLEKDRICSDGRVRSGIWLADSWWIVRHSKTYQQWRDNLIRNPGLRKWDYSPTRERAKYSEAEKAELLESARQACQELGSMKLSAETRALLRQEP